jgi:hypothetical protein
MPAARQEATAFPFSRNRQCMDIPDHIRNAVYNGYVLDTNGQWVTMPQVLAMEREVRQHLEKGEVLVGDAWVPIAQAKGIPSQPG